MNPPLEFGDRVAKGFPEKKYTLEATNSTATCRAEDKSPTAPRNSKGTFHIAFSNYNIWASFP